MLSFSRWLAEIDDTDWHHVDNGWLVDKLLDIYYSKNGKPDQLGGPHYEDQWWIGARSYVSLKHIYFWNI